MISDFPLRSFLFIFSANNLEDDNKSHDISPTFWAVIIGTVSLTPSVSVSPGLGGGAESSVGSSPDKDFQAWIQQEDEAADKEKRRMLWTQCSEFQ